jgi:predicted lipoprotein with Yx(FWY)xxD motif
VYSFPISRPRPRTLLAALGLAVVAVVALLVPTSSHAAGKSVAKQADVESLGETVLTNNAGRTLYSLSVEKNGKFICTGACLSTWHPLTVAAGTHPTGPAKLATVKRPDGRTQVTYKGRPLYTFAGDRAAGQAGGEGLKDVGTWHAAAIAKSGGEAEMPTHEAPPNPYGY